MTQALIAERAPDATAIEQALVSGDLSKLTPAQRVSFYNSVCSSLGLNPLTKPFAYLQLNGKLILYALKDCTEQLRKIHGVSIVDMQATRLDDVYVVTAKAQDKSGRTDVSTGAVPIGSAKGEALANVLMKCETKAKRRVTLSICGLGMLDETEVESIQADSPRGYVVEAEPKGVMPSEKSQLLHLSGAVGGNAAASMSGASAVTGGSASGESHADGPDLAVDLPPGARLITNVGPGRVGAEAEITFSAKLDGGKDTYLTWKKDVAYAANTFYVQQKPCFVELKKSTSGNYRVERLMAVPDDYMDAPA